MRHRPGLRTPEGADSLWQVRARGASSRDLLPVSKKRKVLAPQSRECRYKLRQGLSSKAHAKAWLRAVCFKAAEKSGEVPSVVLLGLPIRAALETNACRGVCEVEVCASQAFPCRLTRGSTLRSCSRILRALESCRIVASSICSGLAARRIHLEVSIPNVGTAVISVG